MQAGVAQGVATRKPFTQREGASHLIAKAGPASLCACSRQAANPCGTSE
jgi:hypothetical protein